MAIELPSKFLQQNSSVEYMIENDTDLKHSKSDPSYRHYRLSVKFLELNNFEKALEHITKASVLCKANNALMSKILILQGEILYKQGKYDDSYQCYLSSLKYNTNLQKDRIEAFNGLGMVGYSSSKYLESLDYYEKALFLSDSIMDEPMKAKLYNSIANVYFSQLDYPNAMSYLNKAIEINKRLNDEKKLAVNLGNLSQIYFRADSIEKGKKLCFQALEIDKKLDNHLGMAFKLANLSPIFSKEGDIDEALRLSLEAYTIFDSIHLKRGIAFTANNIGYYYTVLNLPKKAVKFLETAQKYAYEIRNYDIIASNRLHYSVFYEKEKNYPKALKFCHEHIAWKDSLFYEEKNRITADMEARYKLNQKESEILLINKEMEILGSKEKLMQLKNHSLAIGLLLFLMLGIVIQYRRSQKAKQEKDIIQKNQEIEQAKIELMETRLKNTALEKQKLEDELTYKSQELTNFAIHIVQKNELMSEFKNNLKSISTKIKLEENQKSIKALLLKMNQHLVRPEEIELFQQKIDKEHQSFFQELENNFPTLTKNEKRLCAMLRINLSSKEIASLNNTSYKAVEMARYRLRKKLNLDAHTNLTDFLNHIG